MAEAPQLYDGLEMFMDAYMSLTTCRTERGTVPWTAIAQYAEFYRFDLEQLDTLAYFCGQLDTEFRAWEKERDPSTSGGIGKNGKNRPKRIR